MAVTTEEILKKIEADPTDSVGAFGEEIPSNACVVGNMNSQFKYTQTPEKDNGMQKNAYLEKIAKNWLHRLGGQLKTVEPMGQIGIGAGVLGLGFSGSRTIAAIKANEDRHSIEQRSLNALHEIKRTLKEANTNGSN